MEEQVILRLPPHLAEQLNALVAKDSLPEDCIQLVPPEKYGSRHISFVFNGVSYPSKIVDLPCIVETQKTFDKSAYYKSGDICQMVVVVDTMEELEQVPDALSSGLTPPTTNIRSRHFRKPQFTRNELTAAEQEISEVLEGQPYVQYELVEEEYFVDEIQDTEISPSAASSQAEKLDVDDWEDEEDGESEEYSESEVESHIDKLHPVAESESRVFDDPQSFSNAPSARMSVTPSPSTFHVESSRRDSPMSVPSSRMSPINTAPSARETIKTYRPEEHMEPIESESNTSKDVSMLLRLREELHKLESKRSGVQEKLDATKNIILRVSLHLVFLII